MKLIIAKLSVCENKIEKLALFLNGSILFTSTTKEETKTLNAMAENISKSQSLKIERFDIQNKLPIFWGLDEVVLVLNGLSKKSDNKPSSEPRVNNNIEIKKRPLNAGDKKRSNLNHKPAQQVSKSMNRIIVTVDIDPNLRA